LIRGQVIKGLVRPDVVINMFPLGQLPVMLLEVQIDVVSLMKLLPAGPIRPLHVPLELGGLGRK